MKMDLEGDISERFMKVKVHQKRLIHGISSS